MILADESVDLIIIEAVKKHGIEVFSIFELKRGVSDEEVIQISRNPPRIILTEDKDFGEWVFAHLVKDISVILVRYRYADVHKIASLVVKLIEKRDKDLFGKFVTVTSNKVRIRNIR
ncbi:MAG: DUF5615 family PIN-like protein [Cyclobacteriaceae bacterium]